MRFKEGNKVEVMRRNEDHHGSWFPAKILLIHGDKYSVRFELLLTSKGKPVVERVHEEDVRPCPPPVHGKERWNVGEVAEVFDLHSWRVGKVAKVLNNNHVVIRLFGSIQLREFHVSSLRVQQAWQDNQWVVIEKVSGKKQVTSGYNHSNSKYTIGLGCEANGGIIKEACTGQRYEEDYFRSFSPARTAKKNLSSHDTILPDLLVQGTGRKRKANPKVDGSHQLTKRVLPRKKIGAVVSRFWFMLFPAKEYKIVAVGFDNAGKTTALCKLHLGPILQLEATSKRRVTRHSSGLRGEIAIFIFFLMVFAVVLP